ncbi:cyclic GMP-binding protein C-like [Diadema antillarum]|uniref:cyclic GMP-binding protein C-like n=1 Tax=Diadema antillarum TaxID=105358 RepID=UPI003A8C1E97
MSLSIWDFAGHDVYYTTHQVFLTWRAIYIVVFDLSRDLHSVVPPDSRDECYKTARMNSKSELTCLEFIIFWLNSIFAYAVPPSTPDSSNDKEPQFSPPIFIVGTHRESVDKDSEKIENKVESIFEEIRNAIKKKPYENHVITDFYDVENSRGAGDIKIVALRKDIESEAKKQPYMGEEIPIQYLLFEEAVVTDGQDFKEFKEVAKMVEMGSDDEIVTMLHFYHDLGFIVYFGEEKEQEKEEEMEEEMAKETDKVKQKDKEASNLGDFVILNPQWLIDVFKKVITVLEPSQRDRNVSDAWTRLEDEGILEQRLINSMWKDFSVKERDFLVKLMEMFDLICEAPPGKHERTRSHGESLVMTFVRNTLEGICRQWAKRITFAECFACPECGIRTKFTDGAELQSLKCGIHIINMDLIRSQFGISTGGQSESPNVSRNEKDFVTTAHIKSLVLLVPPGNYADLCFNLGFGYNRAQQILDKFSKDYPRALSDVLNSWTDEKVRSEAELKAALEGAGLGGVYTAVDKSVRYGFPLFSQRSGQLLQILRNDHSAVDGSA